MTEPPKPKWSGATIQISSYHCSHLRCMWFPRFIANKKDNERNQNIRYSAVFIFPLTHLVLAEPVICAFSRLSERPMFFINTSLSITNITQYYPTLYSWYTFRSLQLSAWSEIKAAELYRGLSSQCKQFTAIITWTINYHFYIPGDAGSGVSAVAAFV